MIIKELVIFLFLVAKLYGYPFMIEVKISNQIVKEAYCLFARLFSLLFRCSVSARFKNISGRDRLSLCKVLEKRKWFSSWEVP